MNWSSCIIEELARLKRRGLTFEAAWQSALEAHRPRNGDRGAGPMRLFDEAGRREAAESVVDFTYRVASDAWHNRRPALAHLGHMRDLLDGLEEASSERRSRAGRDDRLVA